MAFIHDIVINKVAPAVEYEATETGFEYHEDRELTWENFALTNVSYMYRVVNATYDGTYWNLQDTSLRAYAYAQLPDGSVSFLASPTESGSPIPQWLPTDWTGSGNFTCFNAADYGMDPGQTALLNAQALIKALDDAALGGGRVFIPAGTYQCDTVYIPTGAPAVGLVIEGAGGSTELVAQDSQSLFVATGSDNELGVRIRDMKFRYPGTGTLGAYYAIYSETSNLICEGCYFTDFPIGVYLGGMHNGLLNCQFYYAGRPGTDSFKPTMIDIERADDFVANCYLDQQAINKGGPENVIGILVGSASEPRVTDTNIVDMDFGIMITGGPNLVHGFFTAIAAECNVTALKIEPNNSTDLCSQLFFNGCVFERTHHSTAVTPGIVIQPNATNENVSDIFFTNCVSHDWGGPGMQIVGGQDIVITGGRFGSNATGSGMSTSGGIAVTGAAVRVSIVGSDFYGQIPPYPSQPSYPSVQPHAVSVTGAVVAMVLRDCNLQGNGTAPPIYVPTNGTGLTVTNCLGYNDQNTSITGAFSGSDYAANHGYYGPSIVAFHAGTVPGSVTVFGATIVGMTFGTIPLLLATDTIDFSATPTTFSWVGK